MAFGIGAVPRAPARAISPRLALVAIWLFGDVLSRSFERRLLPLVGSSHCRWTTLAYAVMWDVGTHAVTGFEWFIVVLAPVWDPAEHGGTARERD